MQSPVWIVRKRIVTELHVNVDKICDKYHLLIKKILKKLDFFFSKNKYYGLNIFYSDCLS